jgi:putative membrane protein
MVHHLIHILVTALAVLVTAKVVPGVRARSFGGAVVFALVLAILNKLLFKLLVVLSLPFVLVTFGLFLIIINAFLFWLADKVVDGVEVDGFGSAILGSLFTSAVTWLVFWVVL